MFNILVLEDDYNLATELVESLRLMGHRATWSDAQKTPVIEPDCDLVMLDLGLGRVDGFQILEQLAAKAAPPPVAIVSGCDRRFMDAAGALATARGLKLVASLSKPFNFSDLEVMLDRLDTPVAVQDGGAGAGRMETPYYVFQYKNDLRTGKPVGCEILVRLPGVTDIAHWFGTLDDARAFDMTVLAAGAAIDLRRRFERQGNPLTVAFNCPPNIFGSAAFLERLRTMCGDAGINTSGIAIELTEQQGTMAILDLSAMACRYSLAGFPIHLDDFGTGTSSVEQLLKLPLAELKIDREVFRNLSKTGISLLSEITAFCRAHDILTTIEGIETEADMIVARQAGADHGQGFFWSTPAPIAQIPVAS